MMTFDSVSRLCWVTPTFTGQTVQPELSLSLYQKTFGVAFINHAVIVLLQLEMSHLYTVLQRRVDRR